MDSNRKSKSNPNPKLYANFFYRFTFCWLYPLFKYGKYNELQAKDLYDVLPANTSEQLGDRLSSLWNDELSESMKSNKQPKLFKAIFKYLGFNHVFYGTLLLVSMLLRIAQPLLLASLITSFQDSTNTKDAFEPYKRATYLISVLILDIFLVQHAHYGLGVISMRLRVACSSVIYRKLSKLSADCISRVSKESVLMLLSHDVYKLDNVILLLHYACIMPLQALLVAYVLSDHIIGRIPTVAGHGFMIVSTLPIQYLLGIIVSQLCSKAETLRKKRILIISELINGIRTIKLYVWEKAFEKIAVSTRRKEIATIKHYTYVKSSLHANLTFTNLLSLLFTILAIHLQGKPLTSIGVYATALCYYYVQLQLALRCPNALHQLSEARSAVKRIEKFLLLDEDSKDRDTSSKVEISVDHGRVIVENVSAKWSDRSITNTLLDVHLHLLPGKRYAIMGPNGAGKSSLVQLILGELKPFNGRIVINGSISYADEEPWLLAGTIRDNILFGESYDGQRYDEVLKLCNLEEDLKLLKCRDLTIVDGCSSGDILCAKVHLARAVYKDADIYLFDEPLSSCDIRLGKRIFEDCFNGLLKEKTCIFVTNHIQYLEKSDEIIFIRNGQIELRGTYSEFEKNDRLFYFLATLGNNSNNESRISLYNNCLSNGNSHLPAYQFENDEVTNAKDETDSPNETEQFIGKKVAKKSLYSRYFFTRNSCILSVTILSLALAQALNTGSFYWIADWVNKDSVSLKRNNTLLVENDESLLEIWILVVLTLGNALLCVIGSILLTKVCLDASKAVHNDMIAQLLKTSIRFFDNNTAERILNRFSKDIKLIDEDLPLTVLQMAQWFFIAIGNLLLIFIAHWVTIFLAPIALYLFYLVNKRYLSTARNIDSLQVAAKNPIISLTKTTLSGLPTIRAQKVGEKLNKEFDLLQNDFISANFLTISSSIAYNFYIDLVSLLFSILITYTVVTLHFFHYHIDANYAGLAVVQAIGFCGAVQIFLKNYTDSLMINDRVKRVIEFTELEKENEVDERMPMSWPKNGGIRFDRVCVRNTDNGVASLKDVTMSIEPGTKVGVVGNDEAGKSSLISALIRLGKIEGSIFIDNVDTKKVNVQQLREKISIVSLKQTIFKTTIRKNLDAVDRHDDLQLWSALESVGLKPVIKSLNTSCEYLNANQLRLLGLARAIVEDNNILILDEVKNDASLDRLIQSIVNDRFKDSTVIKMASKVDNVVDDYDLIVVMDKGRIAQYGRSSLRFARKNKPLPDSTATAEGVDDGDGLAEEAKVCQSNKEIDS